MNHKTKLLEIYKHSYIIDDITDIDKNIVEQVKTLGEKISSQKGVFTVLTTLLTHKIIHSKQDVRYHQSTMENGFSGRTIDTKYITPTLKELKLPSMSESGWLTRSLEQPYPYTLDYNGKISNKKVKLAFLQILDYVERFPKTAKNLLRLLLHQAILIREKSKVKVIPLTNAEKLTIQAVIGGLTIHFNTKYKIVGGSKLPVLAFYAIYQIILSEVKRYENCTLAELGSHTASDRTSKSSGDIEILKGKKYYETVEVKLDKPIDANMVRVAIEKIHRFNPMRYYILSNVGINQDELPKIQELIDKTKEKHGCQIIINGVLPTIKYYLRLVDNTEEFLKRYSDLIEKDKELKIIHKKKWNEIIQIQFNKK